ncbi:MAG: hypothetical protein R3208_20265, partial [Ketobacteraceae bacterium]|nr:hypothetical protein [Ketobacteraceae bacterium]
MSGESGAAILATTDSFRVDFHPSLDPNIIKHGHTALCDPTQEFRQPGERTNPYICGENGENDCYDMTIISSTSNGITFRLWGTPVTVEVANPKTAEARIQNVEVGTSTPGGEVLFSDDWTEPAVTRDGRLLTGRQSLFPRAWTNPNTGKTRIGAWDLAYSVLPEDAEPCDVTGWTRFHPISHAPYDPEMKGRYGLAAYPFRDAHGQIIPDGADVAGTYPWVDRDGANVFMAGVIGRLADQSETKYPRRCVKEGCEKFEQPYDRDRGYMVGGLWTRGKFVHLDAMINNQDWAVGVRSESHYWVDLYRDETGADVPVRFGAGRFSPGPDAGPMPPGYTGNANILDSIENLFNYHEHAKPISGGDVVWIMGTGVATDEIVFDDYMDHNAFIVSNMQASITPLRLGDHVLPIPIYHNGELAAG